MNITLSADKDLIAKSRDYAKAHHTSLNQLIRDFLSRVTGEYNGNEIADEFILLAKSKHGKSNKDFKFSRDDIYD